MVVVALVPSLVDHQTSRSEKDAKTRLYRRFLADILKSDECVQRAVVESGHDANAVFMDPRTLHLHEHLLCLVRLTPGEYYQGVLTLWYSEETNAVENAATM